MLQEYLQLWSRVQNTHLQPGCDDVIRWSWEHNGQHSTRSAYEAMFWGREGISTAAFTWNSGAPMRCRFFTWLAIRNRCWTSDRLVRRGLDHQETCPFCDQEEESIQHILLHCVFGREAGTVLCRALGKSEWVMIRPSSLQDWCTDKVKNKSARKDVRTLFTLVMWELWKHIKAIVFDGATPSIRRVLHRVQEEGRTWKKAGLFKCDTTAFFGELDRWACVRS